MEFVKLVILRWAYQKVLSHLSVEMHTNLYSSLALSWCCTRRMAKQTVLGRLYPSDSWRMDQLKEEELAAAARR